MGPISSSSSTEVDPPPTGAEPAVVVPRVAKARSPARPHVITTVPLKLCFFIDICSGKEAPLTEAVRQSGRMVLARSMPTPIRGVHSIICVHRKDKIFCLDWCGRVVWPWRMLPRPART